MSFYAPYGYPGQWDAIVATLRAALTAGGRVRPWRG